jgi:hypothetical protein
MGTIDILIPLVIGLLFITCPQVIIKAEDPQFEKKKRTFQKIGYGLLGVSILYGIIKLLS